MNKKIIYLLLLGWVYCLAGSVLASTEVTTFSYTEKDAIFKISHIPEINEKPMPIGLVLMLDVSGSMSSPAKKNFDITRVQALKHFMKTVVQFTVDNKVEAVLDIYCFDAEVSRLTNDVVLVSESTDDSQKLIEKIDKITINTWVSEGLQLGPPTNLWAAIEKGFSAGASMTRSYPDHHVNVVVVSDGEPTCDEGHSRSSYMEQTCDFSCADNSDDWCVALLALLHQKSADIKLHCVGVGSDAPARLLSELAVIGNGSYSYICDGSMVLSAGLSLVGHLSSLAKLERPDLKGLMGNIEMPFGGARYIVQPKGSLAIDGCAEEDEKIKHLMQVTNYLQCLVKAGDDDGERCKIKNWLLDLKQNIQAVNSVLADDINHQDPKKGQMIKAIDNWKTWGEPYIRTINLGYTNQQAVNTKDAAMREYFTSKHVEEKLGKGMECAINLNYICPKDQDTKNPKKLKTTTISDLANSSCVGGDTLIKMRDATKGSTKKVKELRSGDIIASADNEGSEILCIIRCHGDFTLHGFDSGSITAWHPWRKADEKSWEFPCASWNDKKKEWQLDIEHFDKKETVVYNLVLNKNHYAISGDREIITLGHGIEKAVDPIAYHPFYGDSEKIKNTFIQKAKNGFVDIWNATFSRDQDGRVSSIEFK